MIVGTAGHIDHGKTTLVRALTGVDTDRLPEEKARGISIELGYAFLDVPGAARRIGFIDVPGHERLVHTMLAGATGIDFGLLLVAADDGVMPQTREHLAVLSLLGLARCAVVITKTDRADAARVAQVHAQALGLLAPTPLAGAPVLPVSAATGDGLPALRELLFDAARATPPRDLDDAAFRLAIDRVFTLGGVGTVVTGTVHAGQVRVGDELVLAPSASGARARVRSLHAQNQAVAQACAGQRCALALAGVAKDDVARGQWLVAPAAALATDRLDATLTLWHDEARPLRSGTPVHVHIGASDTLGTVAVLARSGGAGSGSGAGSGASHGAGAGTGAGTGAGAGAGAGRAGGAGGSGPDVVDVVGAGDGDDGVALDQALAPGRRAFAQIVLRAPIAAWHGDRVVLRDASARRTLAGGMVLDPFAPARYRRTPQRLAELGAWALPAAGARLAGLIDAAPAGVSLTRWARAEGRAGDTPPALLARALLAPSPLSSSPLSSSPLASSPLSSSPLASSSLSSSPLSSSPLADPPLADPPRAHSPPIQGLLADAPHDAWALGARHHDTARRSTLAALRAFHAREPEVLGPDAARLRRLAAPRLPEPLWGALLAGLQGSGQVVARGAFVHLPEHGLRLSAADERLAQTIAPLLLAAGFEGCWARDLARDTRQAEALMRTTLARLARRGELHQVVKDLYYPPATIARLAALAREVAKDRDGAVIAARFRDATGLGRKRAIQILEYFDRIGLLRRVGDAHRLRSDTALFAQPTP